MGRFNGGTILERLDRRVCNKEWLDYFPATKVSLLNWWCSDHRPLLINVQLADSNENNGRMRRNTRFHFEGAWCEEGEREKIIPDCWKSGSLCNSDWDIKQKIKRCRDKLSVWNRRKKSSIMI